MVNEITQAALAINFIYTIPVFILYFIGTVMTISDFRNRSIPYGSYMKIQKNLLMYPSLFIIFFSLFVINSVDSSKEDYEDQDLALSNSSLTLIVSVVGACMLVYMLNKNKNQLKLYFKLGSYFIIVFVFSVSIVNAIRIANIII